jgi:hypothetical protein
MPTLLHKLTISGEWATEESVPTNDFYSEDFRYLTTETKK